MTKKIAVIDFPPEGKDTSFFVNNGAEGPSGLVARIKEQGFSPDLMAYHSLDLDKFDPQDYSAIFFASGFTQIRDYEDGPKSKKTNPALEDACVIYCMGIEEDVPVVAFPHGSQVLAFYSGGDYFKLGEKRTRKEPFGKYSLADDDSKDHWLLKNLTAEDLDSNQFAREYREYGVNLEEEEFRALVNPDSQSTGPAIAIHADPNVTAVLFMIHPEYDKNLPAYRLMDNVFEKIRNG